LSQLANSVAQAGRHRETTPRYVVPFLVFIGFIALQAVAPLPPHVDLPLRVAVIGALLLFFSRPVIQLAPRHLALSLLLGVGVFLVWIGPDLLFPHYRQSWLFNNSLTAASRGPFDTALRQDSFALVFRLLRAILIVPIVEELFWRGWLMRWLIDVDFRKVPLGAYSPLSFWITAVMFASEHGPYWDVGLAAGILYNWWMIRTKSLADCILAHAVTNAVLSAWVIFGGHWEYWL